MSDQYHLENLVGQLIGVLESDAPVHSNRTIDPNRIQQWFHGKGVNAETVLQTKVINLAHKEINYLFGFCTSTSTVSTTARVDMHAAFSAPSKGGGVLWRGIHNKISQFYFILWSSVTLSSFIEFFYS